MTLVQHLEELRHRLLFCVAAADLYAPRRLRKGVLRSIRCHLGSFPTPNPNTWPRCIKRGEPLERPRELLRLAAGLGDLYATAEPRRIWGLGFRPTRNFDSFPGQKLP